MIPQEKLTSRARMLRIGDSICPVGARVAFLRKRKRGAYIYFGTLEDMGLSNVWLPRSIEEIRELGMVSCTSLDADYRIAYFDGITTREKRRDLVEELGQFFEVVIDHTSGDHELAYRLRSAEFNFLGALIEWGLGELPQYTEVTDYIDARARKRRAKEQSSVSNEEGNST